MENRLKRDQDNFNRESNEIRKSNYGLEKELRELETGRLETGSHKNMRVNQSLELPNIR
jgi:hypothetical protein